MRFLPLVIAALWRRPFRTVLTVLSVTVAYVLFGVMQGVVSGFDVAIDKMSDTRLRITSRANIFEPLPMAHRGRIERIPGIKRVAYATIHGFSYQQPSNNVSGAAVDMEAMFDVFPEIVVSPTQREALQSTRTAAVVGSDVAGRFGWKVGDRVPFQSFLWQTDTGTDDWFVDVVAIANTGPEDDKLFATDVYIRHDFLDETRVRGKGTVHMFIAAIEDPAQADELSQAIDREFANSSDETVSMNEKQYMSAQISQVGDIEMFVNAVLGAVLFTLVFLTGTTMMQSIQDRIAELGVMKAVGFTNGMVLSMLFTEALVIYLVAAVAGLTLAAVAFPPVFQSLGLAAVPLETNVFLTGFAGAVLLALGVTIWPAARAGRMSAAQALR